jgi:NTP pyrophosphatase (non-canonical NTP hydrolase)
MLKQDDIVNPGDEVAVYSGGGYGVYRIEKVTERLIILKDGKTFKKNGIELTDKWSKASLHVLTDELRDKIKRASRVEYLKNFAWERVSDELLDELVQVLHRNGFDSIK